MNEPEITWVTVKIWIGESLFYNVRIPFRGRYIAVDPLDPRLEPIINAIGSTFEQQMGLSATRERGGDGS